MSLKDLKKEALKNNAVRAEYDKLASEFDRMDQFITRLALADLTQDDPTKQEKVGVRLLK